jgi:hypothetical protein
VTRRLTTLFLALNAFGVLLRVCGDEASKRPVEVVQTERVSFAPGGMIHVLHSFGSLNVEGWDRPEVEVTVVKSRERYYVPDEHDQAARGLDRIRIVAERHSDDELTISTIFPHKRFPYLWGGKGGVTVEYQVHVPRNSKLTIHHGTGCVLVSNVTGDVEATSGGGDIVLLLPDSGTYSIDARSKLGTVYSDLVGDSHRRYLVGVGFVSTTPPSSHRIYLRTRMGGIAIKAVPAEAGAPVGARKR